MRKVILGLSLIVVGFSFNGFDEAKKSLASDQYKVIKVDGKIIFQKTNVPMKQGDVFLPDTQLEFATPQSRAAVISSLKGRFVLSAAEHGQTNILPATNNVSARAGALNNWVALQHQFSDRLLILGEMKVKTGSAEYPMNDNNFFFLRYFYKEEQIDKKLSFEGDFLILNKDEIYRIDGQPIEINEMEMTMFYQKENNTSEVGTFTPVFPDLINLRTEIEIIIAECSDKGNREKIEEIMGYLDQFYGNPQKDNVAPWLLAEFNLQ